MDALDHSVCLCFSWESAFKAFLDGFFDRVSRRGLDKLVQKMPPVWPNLVEAAVYSFGILSATGTRDPFGRDCRWAGHGLFGRQPSARLLANSQAGSVFTGDNRRMLALGYVTVLGY